PSTTQDDDGDTVYHRAVRWNAIGIMETLLQQDNLQGEALKVVSNRGRTPLTETLYLQHQQMALMILRSCPPGLEYLVSDIPILELATKIGSKRLFCSVMR